MHARMRQKMVFGPKSDGLSIWLSDFSAYAQASAIRRKDIPWLASEANATIDQVRVLLDLSTSAERDCTETRERATLRWYETSAPRAITMRSRFCHSA